MRNGFSEEYKDRKIDLEKKKESLWKGGDLGKWKVDQDNLGVKLNQLSNDKSLAKKHMLPKVNSDFSIFNPKLGDQDHRKFEGNLGLLQLLDHQLDKVLLGAQDEAYGELDQRLRQALQQ